MKSLIFAASVLVCIAGAADAEPYGADLVGKHGVTHASAKLQDDVNTMMQKAVPALVLRATGDQKSVACGKMLRTDAVVTHMDSPQQWSETWTYQVCQTQIALRIDFTPDGKGGANFAINPENIRPISAQ